MFSISQKLMSIVFIIALSGCSSAYYSAMEKVGIHKRDIMVDRVVDAKESQQEAQAQFKSALEEMMALTDVDGGDLEEQYNIIQAQYEDSKDAAEHVSSRIEKIEDVADALFDEWQDEIEQISSANLKRQSTTKFRETQRRYQSLIKSMHKAESKMAPVLSALKDNSLFLKHNLNAKAVGALQGEMGSIKRDVSVLIKDMNLAIEQSQKFIDMLEN
ncbi:MAG: DNA repair protein [Gammaproteobacteria bacterium]|nr:MAG: DNA repair protein [Gammaproteobacteria bacterium]PHR84572.1 MAG: DNA repair protein [Colwellia sp.]